MTLGPALAGGIRLLSIEVDPNAQKTLLAYVGLLAKWNRIHNLTAIREPQQMVTHHVLDSLSVLPHLPHATRLGLIDIGSGAGLPGIPLAVARPGWRVALLDSNHKKAAFLRQAAAELGLENVEVVACRAEDFHPEPPFEVAIARAYSDLKRVAREARRLTCGNALWLAMKGAYPGNELADLPADVKTMAVTRLRIPGVDAERHLVVMRTA